MAKTTADSLKIEVWGSDRVANGAPALVEPSQTTIEKGFVDGIANANDFTWVPNVLGAKINHVLQNGVPLWNNITTYAIGNVANHTNSLWIALASNTNSAPTDVNANWRKLATVDLIPTLNSLLPSQTGNANKVLTTNGTNASWANVPFATVNFDGTTAANLTGTFTRTGNTVTVNVTGHGHIVGHRIAFVGAGITSDWYTVATVIDANSFTFTSGTGTISSTACTLYRRSIRKSTNVQSVAYSPTSSGEFAVNFSSLATDTNYCIAKDVSVNTGNLGGNIFAESHGSGSVYYAPTTAYFHLRTLQNGLGLINLLYNNVSVFP